MPTNIIIQNGTSIILANSGDHSPTSGQSLTGTRTDQLNLTSLAAGAYRQSTKFDFGATRAVNWFMRAAIEPVSAPAATSPVVEFFLGFSDSATAGVNNPGNLSGSDSAYTAYGAAATDADEQIGQLVRVGRLVFSADDDVHVGEVGIFTPTLRYGMLVVRNGLAVALESDAVEMSVHLIPIQDVFND